MLEYFMATYAEPLLLAALCAVFGMAGRAVKMMVKSWLDSETKLSVAKIAVQFVEQTWKALHGPEKLQQALVTARELLGKKGIDFDAEEMEVLIEAAVAEFNEAFKKPLAQQAEAEAVRRVEERASLADRLH